MRFDPHTGTTDDVNGVPRTVYAIHHTKDKQTVLDDLLGRFMPWFEDDETSPLDVALSIMSDLILSGEVSESWHQALDAAYEYDYDYVVPLTLYDFMDAAMDWGLAS